MRNLLTILFILSALSPVKLLAQEDLLSLFDEENDSVINYTTSTFESTRLVSAHTIETNNAGVLQFLIQHRFGRVNSGWRELYGIDNANMRLDFHYGITDNIDIGIGRSSFKKTYDGMFKWKFLSQKSGFKNFPVTATWISSSYVRADEWQNPNRDNLNSSRLSYHHALMVARKFNSNFSAQLSPTILHRNLVPTKEDQNTIFSLGMLAAYRINHSLKITAEYYLTPEGQYKSLIAGEKLSNALSIGFDLETGGHVFQIHITNSRGMAENYIIGETTGNWLDGDIHIGFNISRVFTVRKPKEFR